MSIKDMPCVTVEQVVRLRNKAIQIEAQRDRLREALEKVESMDSLQGHVMKRIARAALAETEEDGERGARLTSLQYHATLSAGCGDLSED